MEIGTNRPDAMNHYGVAREAAAFYAVPLKPIEVKLPSARKHNPSDAAGPQAQTAGRHGVEIDIEDKEGCARYTAQIIRGVTIKASSEKIASRRGARRVTATSRS